MINGTGDTMHDKTSELPNTVLGHFDHPDTLPGLRIIFAAFVLLYGAVAYTDILYFPEDWPLLWVLRFGVVIPLLISTIILSYRSIFKAIQQMYVAVNVFVGGAVIAVMFIWAPHNIIYYGGLFMVLFSGYFILRLRFWYATAVGWGIVLFYFIGALASHGRLDVTSVHAMAYFAGANLIGMIGLKYLENLHRRQVRTGTDLINMNAKLQQSSLENEKQLEQLTQFITENRTLHEQYLEQQAHAQALQTTRKRFEDLARNTKTFYYEINPDGQFTYVSNSIEALLGYHPEQLVGKRRLQDLFPEETRTEDATRLFAATSPASMVEDRLVSLHGAKGQVLWVNTHLHPVIDESGAVCTYQGTAMDMTEKRAVQNALEAVRPMVTQADFGAALADLEGKFVYVNDAFCRMHGYTREALIGQPIAIVHDPLQMPRVDGLIAQLLDHGRYTSEEVWHRKADGTLFPTMMSAALVVQDGKPRYMSATILDITELEQTKTELLDAEKRYRLVSELSNTGVWEFNIEQNYLWCSPEYFSLLGYEVNRFQLAPDNLDETWLDLLHPDDRVKAQQTFARFIAEKPGWLYENRFRMRNASGDYRWIWSRGNFIRDNRDAPTGTIIGTHIDITEQTLKELEIERLSKYDYLTDIPNRRYFQEQLAMFTQPAYYPLAIAIIDVNGLKLVNDSFGHSTGNQMLKQVAAHLDAFKRPTDFVARIGGDEFVLLCPNTDAVQMDTMRQDLNRLISEERIEGIAYSLAFGYDILHTERQNVRDVLKDAENHMYKNKVIFGSSTRNQAVMTILQTLTTKYKEERVHSERVSRYCRQIGEVMQLREEELVELELAGKLHDIGKISIPDHILSKPGPLTEDEWVIMKEHTINGYQILRAADRYSNLAEYAMSHHERMDGNGYPNGLKGKAIPLYARIICVADAYEAMTSDRYYRKGMKVSEAKAELKKNAGSQFDPDIVNIFINKVLKRKQV
ncbi:MAG: PAS domain S-box protein [Acholeplasmatales bacterium]|nr:MAG: PAS domain S-box protein [Acholeplasmatales bacterium]